MDCITDLVSIKNLTENAPEPLFWLDDLEGIDRETLAQITKPTSIESTKEGRQFGLSIIESASRLLMADIESLIPKGYSIKSSLNSFCNTCTYTNISSGEEKTGIVVKNVSTSKNTKLSIDSLKVMTGSTGDYTIVLDDGSDPKVIEGSFTAGIEKIITGINFKTSEKLVKIYFQEEGVLATALSCPTTKSCGCSGRKADSSSDVTVKGLLDDAEFTTQYGFVPCASVICSLDNIICSIVDQQPRLFGLTLLYRSAARYFSEFQVTQRNNRNASFNEDEKTELSEHYMNLYYERLRGSENVKGINDNMAAALNNLNDACVTCERKQSIGWAVS